MKKTACKQFFITLNHFRSRRCTFFFILLHFFNSQHSSAPDRDQSWPRSGIFRNLPNFDRLYLRAQLDFFQNVWFFLKLRPSSRRYMYVDLERLLVHLTQSDSILPWTFCFPLTFRDSQKFVDFPCFVYNLETSPQDDSYFGKFEPKNSPKSDCFPLKFLDPPEILRSPWKYVCQA